MIKIVFTKHKFAHRVTYFFFLAFVICCLLSREDPKYLLTTLTIPKSFSRMFIIRVWLIVSKAVLRISLYTLTSAVSVEWCFL